MAISKTILATLGLVGSMLAACCDKDSGPVPGEQPGTDRFDVLLKQVDVRNTAAPFYFFTYNDSGYATTLAYHEDMYVYHYFYKRGRIDSVTSSATDARYFLYKYTDHRVSSIQQYDGSGLRLTVFIRYDDRGRVIKMDWQPAMPGPEEKHSVFTYYEDGNVKHMESAYPSTGLTTIVDFEAYDNKRSVDGFDIYREFLEHVILLPTIKFHRNNPTRVKQANGSHVRVSRINYVYRGDLPVERHTVTDVTEGPAAGDHYTGFASFVYY